MATAVVSLLVVVSCGLAGASRHAVAFVDMGSAATSRHTGGPAIIIATTNAGRVRIAALRPGAVVPADVVGVAVFEGQQPSGGFDIRVRSVERDGDRLLVHAIFVRPLDNAFFTQATTSPMQLFSIPSAEATGLREGMLFDEVGEERARASVE